MKLQHGAQEAVMVNSTCRISVQFQEVLGDFYRNFCSAIELWEGDRR